MSRATMRLILLPVFTMLSCSLSFPQQHSPAVRQKARKPGPMRPQEIAAVLTQSLVMLETKDKAGKPIGLASGFYVEKNTIITNAHVLKWAHSIVATEVRNGLQFNIDSVLMLDRKHDLCTLSVKHEGVPVKLAAGVPRVGDSVYALGNPLGLQATFSTGIVSAIRADAIQIDAPISHGSSGGPVANNSGEVIGVSTSFLAEGQNLNFAVPVSDLKTEADNLPVSDAGRIALTDRKFSHLSGAVKSVKLRWSRISSFINTELPPLRLVSAEQYDFQGNVIESCLYGDKGIKTCSTFERGEDTLIRQTRNSDGIAPESSQSYDHKQALDFELTRHRVAGEFRDSSDPNMTWVYDSFGDVIELRENGRAVVRMTNDKPGLETEQFEFDHSGNAVSRSVVHYEFDAKGNWIMRTQETFFRGRRFTEEVETREIDYW